MFYPLLTIFFGVVGLWIARYGYARVREARDWPTVQGHILERGVGEPMGSGRAYLPYARYVYSVGDVDYTNDQVYLIRGTGGLADSMYRLVDGLPDPVPVHYDPAQPARSYLLSQPMGTLRIAAVFGVVVTAAGLLMLLVALFSTTPR